MADKPISALPEAPQITLEDLFVLEQASNAKKLTGKTLLNCLAALLDGHGGIQNISKIDSHGLVDTYQILFSDGTKSEFTVTNGRGIKGIEKTSSTGNTDIYTITYSDETTSSFSVKNGSNGADGASAYVWIKYASVRPTEDNPSIGDIPDSWMGIYSGALSSAPTDWHMYRWSYVGGNRGLSFYRLNASYVGSVERYSFSDFLLPEGYSPMEYDLVMMNDGWLGYVFQVFPELQQADVASLGESLQGPQGIQGVRGIPGEMGPAGERGLSFYRLNASLAGSVERYSFSDFFLPEGYVPMEHDLVLTNDGWLCYVYQVFKETSEADVASLRISLKGADGARGIQGPQGEKGEKGDKGEGAQLFVIKVTQNADGSYSADKTRAEAVAAYEAGMAVYCDLPHPGNMLGVPIRIPLVSRMPWVDSLYFETAYDSKQYRVVYYYQDGVEPFFDNAISVQVTPLAKVDLTGYATEDWVRQGFQPRGNYLTEHQDISGKLNKSGWGANKNLGTDENGNVIEKEDIFSKDTSAWQPVSYLPDSNVAWRDTYYWNTSGELVSTQYTSGYVSVDKMIAIEPNCEYTLTNFAGVATLYDASGKNGVVCAENTAPANPVHFKTASTHRFIGISFRPSGAFTKERVSLERTTISDAEYNALPTKADSLKSLYGKKVVCFGDSLFGMYRGADSSPAFVALETGATVYNVGFGGCRMSVHPSNGYAAFSMWALAKAVAENNWTMQDAQVSSGSDYFPEQLALLKSIDFNDVDIVVIHYGTNDFGAGNAIAIDNANDHDDYNTLCGALRYSIEKLLGAYPKIRIFVSLPVYRFWNDNSTITYAETYLSKGGKTLPEFVEALRNTAAEYNLPVIDGYYGLGINKANAATFLSDGTHHNAAGRERFGRYIGANLIAQQTSGKSGMDVAAVTALIDAAIGEAMGGAY